MLLTILDLLLGLKLPLSNLLLPLLNIFDFQFSINQLYFMIFWGIISLPPELTGHEQSNSHGITAGVGVHIYDLCKLAPI